MTRLSLLLLGLSLASGCGTTSAIAEYLKGDSDNAEPPAELVEFRTRLNVIKLWSKNIGSGTDKQYLKLSPVIFNQRLYIADADGTVQALDATNGKKVWSTDVDAEITGGTGFGLHGREMSLEGGNVNHPVEDFWRRIDIDHTLHIVTATGVGDRGLPYQFTGTDFKCSHAATVKTGNYQVTFDEWCAGSA